MTFKLGLTGSIGMGKSTTAKFFEEMGCAVWDADAAVHRLYSKGGLAVAPIGRVFPDAIEDNAVSRDRLKGIISENSKALGIIEAIVHPLVAEDREAFLKSVMVDIAVFDIPLLFETGGEKNMDAVACVSVDPDTQRNRVLERGTLSEKQFETILAKQIPDTEKQARSDYVIITDTLEHARVQVQDVVKDIRDRLSNA